MKKTISKPLAAIALSATLFLSAAASADAYSYRIQPGDTMYKLAQAEGISVESVRKANPSVDPMKLQIGQVIEVPLPDEKTYTVQKGDTYWKISTKFGIPLLTLMQLNPTLQANNLYAGLKLRLPAENGNNVQNTLTSAASETNRNAAQTVMTPNGEQSYQKVIQAKASAYTADPAENGGWAGLDYMGNKLTLGTIAVDPDVIPLGTSVYVTGYDYDGLPQGGFVGKATDVGGAIKGNRIDIFVPQTTGQARKFGFQEVKVYILE